MIAQVGAGQTAAAFYNAARTENAAGLVIVGSAGCHLRSCRVNLHRKIQLLLQGSGCRRTVGDDKLILPVRQPTAVLVSPIPVEVIEDFTAAASAVAPVCLPVTFIAALIDGMQALLILFFENSQMDIFDIAQHDRLESDGVKTQIPIWRKVELTAVKTLAILTQSLGLISTVFINIADERSKVIVRVSLRIFRYSIIGIIRFILVIVERFLGFCVIID
ncbi:hypothetical protein STRDD11_01534 [Streptococcus sp. DD11]|nr:hypothetical protein STRDD11_01534 [Streptococcus sp. DD11]